MKNKTVLTLSSIFLLVFSLHSLSAVPSCKALGDICGSNSNCCAAYLTDHGNFYGYCGIGTCRIADGINENLNELQWCNAHAGDSYYKSTNPEGKDYLGWDPAVVSCNDLFYGFEDNTAFPHNFEGIYDNRNKQTLVFGEGQRERIFYDNNGYGGAYASDSSITGLVFSSIDPGGRLHKSTDANGNKVLNFYDSLDRVVKTLYVNGTNAIEGIHFEDIIIDYQVEFFYDTYRNGESCSESGIISKSFNLLCEVKDNSGGEKFLYDNRERVIQTTKIIHDPFRGDESYTLSFTYDDASNVKTMTMPNGNILQYTYNNLNQLIEISEGPTETFAEFSYNPTGSIAQKILNSLSVNKIFADFTYNSREFLTSLWYAKGNSRDASNTYFKKAMKYDAVGNILKIGDTFDSTDPENTLSSEETYTYDNLYRLNNSFYEGNISFDYAYKNKMGDRETKIIKNANTQAIIETTGYVYDGKSRLDTLNRGGNTVNMIYDNNGNLIKLTEPGKVTKLTYDSLNRLKKVDVNNGAIVNFYYYDYKNQRVKKVDSAGVTFYLYQGNNVIYETKDPFTRVPLSAYVENEGDVDCDFVYPGKEFDSSFEGFGVVELCSGIHNLDQGIIVSGDDLSVICQPGTIIQGPGDGTVQTSDVGIKITGVGSIVSDCEVRGFGVGVESPYRLEKINANNNYIGVKVSRGGADITLTNNYIGMIITGNSQVYSRISSLNNKIGIQITGSGNKIEHSDIRNNFQSGIQVIGASIDLDGNIVTFNGIGIEFLGSSSIIDSDTATNTLCDNNQNDIFCEQDTVYWPNNQEICSTVSGCGFDTCALSCEDSICTESDGGFNIYEKGNCQQGDFLDTDRCADPCNIQSSSTNKGSFLPIPCADEDDPNPFVLAELSCSNGNNNPGRCVVTAIDLTSDPGTCAYCQNGKCVDNRPKLCKKGDKGCEIVESGFGDEIT